MLKIRNAVRWSNIVAMLVLHTLISACSSDNSSSQLSSQAQSQSSSHTMNTSSTSASSISNAEAELAESFHITFPPNDSDSVAVMRSIIVRGSAVGLSDAQIKVNGIVAELDDIGQWSARIPLEEGFSEISAVLTVGDTTVEKSISIENHEYISGYSIVHGASDYIYGIASPRQILYKKDIVSQKQTQLFSIQDVDGVDCNSFNKSIAFQLENRLVFECDENSVTRIVVAQLDTGDLIRVIGNEELGSIEDMTTVPGNTVIALSRNHRLISIDILTGDSTIFDVKLDSNLASHYLQYGQLSASFDTLFIQYPSIEGAFPISLSGFYPQLGAGSNIINSTQDETVNQFPKYILDDEGAGYLVTFNDDGKLVLTDRFGIEKSISPTPAFIPDDNIGYDLIKIIAKIDDNIILRSGLPVLLNIDEGHVTNLDGSTVKSRPQIEFSIIDDYKVFSATDDLKHVQFVDVITNEIQQFDISTAHPLDSTNHCCSYSGAGVNYNADMLIGARSLRPTMESPQNINVFDIYSLESGTLTQSVNAKDFLEQLENSEIVSSVDFRDIRVINAGKAIVFNADYQLLLDDVRISGLYRWDIQSGNLITLLQKNTEGYSYSPYLELGPISDSGFVPVFDRYNKQLWTVNVESAYSYENELTDGRPVAGGSPALGASGEYIYAYISEDPSNIFGNVYVARIDAEYGTHELIAGAFKGEGSSYLAGDILVADNIMYLVERGWYIAVDIATGDRVTVPY